MFLVLSDGNPRVHLRWPYVNLALIALCIALFLAVLNPHFPALSLAFYPSQLFGAPVPAEAAGPPAAFRLLTHQFLHANIAHIGGNMLLLWVFGDNVEDSMGHWRYAAFYLACGIAAALAEGFADHDPQTVMVGASGAVSGVLGAYLLLHPRAKLLVVVCRFPVYLPAWVAVGFYIGSNLVMAFVPEARALAGGEVEVAWWAHVGGFVAGAALVPFVKRRDVTLWQPAPAEPERAKGSRKSEAFVKAFAFLVIWFLLSLIFE